jgi:hypothetical protein
MTVTLIMTVTSPMRLVDARAEDDVRVLVRLLLHERRGLLDLLHLDVGPPTTLMSTPVAPSTEMSSRSGDEIAISAARRARPWPLAQPVPMSARPMLLMTVFTSAKSTLTMPLCVMRSLMPLIGLVEDLVGLAEGVDEAELLVAEHEELLVRDRDERVDVLGEHGEADARRGASAACPRRRRAW